MATETPVIRQARAGRWAEIPHEETQRNQVNSTPESRSHAPGQGTPRTAAALSFELSEARQRLFAGAADMAPTELREAEQRIAGLEGDWQRAVRREENEENDRAVPRDLIRRVELRSYIQAAAQEKALLGAELELNKEVGLDDRNQVPYAALLADEHRAAINKMALEESWSWETRADAYGTINDSAVARNNQEVLRRVFERTITRAFFEVMMPAAPRGLPNYPVFTSAAAGQAVAAGAAIDAESYSYSGSTIDLTRIGARYMLRVEDIARMAGLESVLRSDLRMILGVLLDKQILNGDGVAPNVRGFFPRTADVANPGAVATIADFDGHFADRVDGIYAASVAGVKMLIDVPVYRFLYKNRTSQAGGVVAGKVTGLPEGRHWTDVVAEGTGGMRATTQGPAAVANVSKGITFVPRELRSYAPVWQGLELIRDPYTGAAKGEVALTMFMLFGFDCIRDESLTQIRIKTA